MCTVCVLPCVLSLYNYMLVCTPCSILCLYTCNVFSKFSTLKTSTYFSAYTQFNPCVETLRMTLLFQKLATHVYMYKRHSIEQGGICVVCYECYTVNTVETRYLLATCYYRAGHMREAMHLLKSDGELRDVQSRLLYARCCLDLKE